MKKVLTLLALLITGFIYAQQKTEVIDTEFEGNPSNSLYRKNEVRVNIGYLIFKGVEFSYERILNDDIGVGVSSLLFSYDQVSDETVKFHMTPYARYYFGKKPASGFFVEGFASLHSKDYWTYSGLIGDTSKEKTHTGVAFGFGIGVKWIKRSGFSIEISGGIGREPASSDRTPSPFMGKGGVAIGLRF